VIPGLERGLPARIFHGNASGVLIEKVARKPAEGHRRRSDLESVHKRREAATVLVAVSLNVTPTGDGSAAPYG